MRLREKIQLLEMEAQKHREGSRPNSESHPNTDTATGPRVFTKSSNHSTSYNGVIFQDYVYGGTSTPSSYAMPLRPKRPRYVICAHAALPELEVNLHINTPVATRCTMPGRR
jgi:hypothetical protein